ncbi:MAG: glycosyltransferase [Paludibacteraceae bacterium]|nr:glycosyltransferase [Paludibacteraceae bacterium]
MPKISVISPVYNISRYLTSCMDSLRGQTLREIEVLFVDDRGTDNSVEIIHNYIKAHSLQDKWRVITMPENGGPGAARNMGIQEATGEYIAFVDADDWAEPAMFEVLYNAAKATNADLSAGATSWDYPDGHHSIAVNPYVGTGILNKSKRRFLLRHYISNFYSMLYRREWLIRNGISFPAARSGEDSSFMGQCYLVAERIAQCDEPFYHYVIHADSISHKRRVWRGREKRKAFRAMLAFAKAHHLLSDYRLTLYWIYFKKVIATSLIDYLKTL